MTIITDCREEKFIKQIRIDFKKTMKTGEQMLKKFIKLAEKSEKMCKGKIK